MERTNKCRGDYTIQEAFDICDKHEHCEDCPFYDRYTHKCVFERMPFLYSGYERHFIAKKDIDEFLKS
jgi:hypothetical protein